MTGKVVIIIIKKRRERGERGGDEKKKEPSTKSRSIQVTKDGRKSDRHEKPLVPIPDTCLPIPQRARDTCTVNPGVPVVLLSPNFTVVGGTRRRQVGDEEGDLVRTPILHLTCRPVSANLSPDTDPGPSSLPRTPGPLLTMRPPLRPPSGDRQPRGRRPSRRRGIWSRSPLRKRFVCTVTTSPHRSGTDRPVKYEKLERSTQTDSITVGPLPHVTVDKMVRSSTRDSSTSTLGLGCNRVQNQG